MWKGLGVGRRARAKEKKGLGTAHDAAQRGGRERKRKRLTIQDGQANPQSFGWARRRTVSPVHGFELVLFILDVHLVEHVLLVKVKVARGLPQVYLGYVRGVQELVAAPAGVGFPGMRERRGSLTGCEQAHKRVTRTGLEKIRPGATKEKANAICCCCSISTLTAHKTQDILPSRNGAAPYLRCSSFQ